MLTVDYAPALDPLLEVSLPTDWLAAVVPEPGQLLAKSRLPEDQLLSQLLSGSDEQHVATRLVYIYYLGIGSEARFSGTDTQLSVQYNRTDEEYELSSALSETTIQTPAEATDWVSEQCLAVEHYLETLSVLRNLAEDIHGLGNAGVRGLAERFETRSEILDADVVTLADVSYVDKDHATALQTALADIDAVERPAPTPTEQTLRSVDGPLIFDIQEGPVPGELVPHGEDEPTYRTTGLGGDEVGFDG